MIIIIGSSKGLGKSIHKMFADKRLLLVSRTSTKVESENHFHIECDINNFDYSKIGKILEDEEIEAIFYTVGLSLIEDRFNISDEDRARSESYSLERKRKKINDDSDNFENWIKNLELKINVENQTINKI